ncbi:MAG: hypothetical protein ACQETH_05060 [Candidatus Rifleibacteriota bacterium]
MTTENKEILLVNSVAPQNIGSGIVVRSKIHFAPLGLYCLQAMAPERISVIDLQESMQVEDCLGNIIFEQIKTVILRLTSAHSSANAHELVKKFRSIFKNARIGISGEVDAHAVTGADFYIYGTGQTILLKALRGEKIEGLQQSMEKDLELEIPVPAQAFAERYNYNAEPEKIIREKTIEVFQPWLGLFEYGNKLEKYPGSAWFVSLAKWLRQSGYKEFHFRPSGITPEHMHELRSLMLSCECTFAASFNEPLYSSFKSDCAGYPLAQVWFYKPGIFSSNSECLSCCRLLREKRMPVGFALTDKSVEMNDLPDMLKLADRMAVIDIRNWKIKTLKKVFYWFWAVNHRFFKRLFKVKTAGELIGFMKTAAIVLEVMFTKERG